MNGSRQFACASECGGNDGAFHCMNVLRDGRCAVETFRSECKFVSACRPVPSVCNKVIGVVVCRLLGLHADFMVEVGDVLFAHRGCRNRGMRVLCVLAKPHIPNLSYPQQQPTNAMYQSK